MMIKIVKLDKELEIFYFIQGEGKNMGQFSIFVCIFLCNLYCSWCDIDYIWNWEGICFIYDNDVLFGYWKFKKEEVIVEMILEEIVEVI